MSQFHITLTAIAHAQDILRSDSSLEDKLMKLNGLMHMGDSLVYADKSIVSHELSSFLPRLAALAVDKANASDILMKNVLWQMLTHIVILNDLLEKSEEAFLTFVSTLFQLGFNSELPWLFREGVLSCLTELETTYPGLLVRALPRIYRQICFDKSPAIQQYLMLFSLILNHCFVLSYDIALDDLKQELSITSPKSSPQKGKQAQSEGGVKLSFKYVVSYRVFKSKDSSTESNSFQEQQMVTVIRDRMKLCSPAAHAYIKQQLFGLEVSDDALSNNLMYLFDYISRNPGESGSLSALSNSDFLSSSFKHMLLSWYLSFINENPDTRNEDNSMAAVSRSVFCNTHDVSLKQLVCASTKSSQIDEAISCFNSFTSADSETLLGILRYMIVANYLQNQKLVMSLSGVLISHIFNSRKEHSSAINSMACEALDSFKNSSDLVESFSRQFDAFCLGANSDKNQRVARLIGDFLPLFSELTLIRQDFDKNYLLTFCELMMSGEKNRHGLTTEKAIAFLNFLCSFLSLCPQYIIRNSLGENQKMLRDLAELELDIGRLAIALICFAHANPAKVVPCDPVHLVSPSYSILNDDELKWVISWRPVCDYAQLEIALDNSTVVMLPDFTTLFAEASSKFMTNEEAHFTMTFDSKSIIRDKYCYALTVELFALSPVTSVDRKIVGEFAIPVVDFDKTVQIPFIVRLDKLSSKQPYHEKLIARVSFSTKRSNVFACWLKPFSIKLTDVLVPLRLTGDHCLGDMFVSSLSESIEKMDSCLGWTDSIFRTFASPEKLANSDFQKFVLFKTDEYCLVGGFVPPQSLVLINFRYNGVISSSPTSPSSVSMGDLLLANKDLDDDETISLNAKRRQIREFVDKYSTCCFAFIYTNNAKLLRHIYLQLDSTFNQQ